MEGYDPTAGPGFGWPSLDLPWVNPSPNAGSLNMARCYPGSVLLEGTTLSEGRGTTRPLEGLGAPGLDAGGILRDLADEAPGWTDGCLLRPCAYEPTFQKHRGELCRAIHVHADHPGVDPRAFRPHRLFAMLIKLASRRAGTLWSREPYEYERERLAIDLISGGPGLREWVEDPSAKPADLDSLLAPDERAWVSERRPHLLYPE